MSAEIVPIGRHIACMSDGSIAKARETQERILTVKQVEIPTEHVIHAGMYTRTIFMPPNTELVGAHIKIPTLFIIHGEAVVYTEEGPRRLAGYNVFTASANRKQVVYSIGEVYISMIFATQAKDVETAEKEFTDEFELLGSHRDTSFNRVLITGE